MTATRVCDVLTELNIKGEFYRVNQLRMTPSLLPELVLGIFVSWSLQVGLAAA